MPANNLLHDCRSEDIELFKLAIHKDSDNKIMNELGKLN